MKLTLLPASESVKITDPDGKDITGKTVTIPAKTYQLKAAASPTGALQKFTWKSSDTDTAAVSSAGKVTFKKAGTVTITATAKDRGKASAKVKLTLKPAAASVIILNPKGKAVTGKTVTVTGKTYQLKAKAKPAGALQKFTWKSSDTDIAAVSSAGKVTFKKAGTVTITAIAKDRGKASAKVKLTKKAQTLAKSVTVDISEESMVEGRVILISPPSSPVKMYLIKTGSIQLKASALPAKAQQTFTWISSDKNVATVTSAGKVTFRLAGEVTITAKAKDGSGKSAKIVLMYGN